MREYLQRVLAPRLVVATGRTRGLARLRAAAARAAGGAGRIELYFSFDDPYAAVALPPLEALLRERAVDLVLYPLIERGIPGDPAAGQRAVQAVRDARRLGERDGRTLIRSAPLPAGAADFLAHWAESLRGSPRMNAFAAAALEQLWFGSETRHAPEVFASLHRKHAGTEPPATTQASALARNRRRMLRKGQWESPAALLGGEWFFAHERIAQIGECLDDLGWTAP